MLLPDKLMCRVHHGKLGWIWVSWAEESPAWKKESWENIQMALEAQSSALDPQILFQLLGRRQSKAVFTGLSFQGHFPLEASP